MKRLLISFSGGRTSGYMTWRVLQEWQDRYDEIVVLFANTSQEHEKTLEFVHNCDKHFGFNTVWLEAEVNPQKGEGTRHRVVDFDSASRMGEPFEAVIAKYGLPGPQLPHCTRELKLSPMQSYVRSIGWKPNTYDQVIGIRADEIDRMSPSASEHRLMYPLVALNVTKTQVLDWWAEQAFDLDLPELAGNCVWCHRKSDRKLFTLAKYHPEYFDFPLAMESHYSAIGAADDEIGERRLFRRHRKAVDIIASSKEPFTDWTPDDKLMQQGLFSLDEMDVAGCSESCEVEYI